jgi:hypothetical protein
MKARGTYDPIDDVNVPRHQPWKVEAHDLDKGTSGRLHASSCS